MAEEINISEAVAEVKSASEEDLKKVIEDWFEKTRTQGLRIGAKYISAAVYAEIQKHTKKASKVTLRDYERMTAGILNIVTKQLVTEQNDSQEVDTKDGE